MARFKGITKPRRGKPAGHATERTAKSTTRRTAKSTTRRTAKGTTRRTAKGTTRRTAKGTTRRTAKGTTRRLLPVMRPGQNLREIIKQCIMLEDHLVQPRKRCPDCITKHMLAIEALAEECGSLCGSGSAAESALADRLAQTTRVMQHAWARKPKDEATCRAVAEHTRAMRKQLMRRYATLPVDSLPTSEMQAVMAQGAGRAGRAGRARRKKKQTRKQTPP